MKRVVLIPMRLGSTRLPGKGLRTIGPYTSLELLGRRLRNARSLDAIVLCTTTLPEDDRLAEHAAELGLQVYRGSRDDVLLRLTEAAESQQATQVAEVDGDDIFCDWTYVDLGLALLEERSADFLMFEGLPLGVTPHMVRVDALRRAVEEKASDDTSTGAFNYILKSGRVRVVREPAPAEHREDRARMTLDYAEDLAFFEALVDRLGERATAATLDEVLEVLRREPALMELNAGLDERYWAHFHSRESSAEARPGAASADGRA